VLAICGWLTTSSDLLSLTPTGISAVRAPFLLSAASAHRQLGSAYVPLGARTEPAARCLSARGDISREFP
jgi:hypothetical protein